MRYMRSLRMIIATLLVISISTSFADGTNVHSPELSMSFLGQVFGYVPGSGLSGIEYGLAGHLFKVFNQGVMAVASVWLIYSITQVLLVTGLNENPQKHLKNGLLWLRVAMGFGLIIPLPGAVSAASSDAGSSGYSIAQTIVMQVVVQGVKLADSVWDNALDYFQQGGLIFATPFHGNSNHISEANLGSYIGNSSSGPDQHTVMYKLLQNQVCMDISNNYNAQHNNPQHPLSYNAPTYHALFVAPKFTSTGDIQANTGVIYFPGYSDKSVSIPQNGTPADSCGSVTVNISDVLAKSKTAQHLQYNEAFYAMQSMLMQLQPLSAKIAANEVPSSSSDGSSQASLTAVSPSDGIHIFNAMLAYMKGVRPISRAYQNGQSLADSSDLDFIAQAKAQGWMNAGAFLWEILKYNDDQDNASGSHFGTNIGKMAPTFTSPIAFTQAAITEDITNGLGQLGNNTSGPWNYAINSLSEYMTGKPSNGIAGVAAAPFGMGLITGTLTAVATEVHHISNDPAANFDPIFAMHNLGVTFLKDAGVLWAAFVVLLSVLAIACGICTAASPGAVIFKAINAWLTPIVSVMAIGLFTAGVMLAFYMPLYPYLLFLFGVVGWLIYVVEAMAAAPLVCFGMTHPEGHDFLGQAQQALMLLLGVFLRPALMVIGFLMGILLSYVCFELLNNVLGQVFTSAFTESYSTAATTPMGGIWQTLAGNSVASGQGIAGHYAFYFVDALLFPVLLVIYGSIVIEVVNQCFSLVYQLPDTIMRWIGGPTQQSTAAQQAQAVRGATMGAANQAGRLGQSGIDGVGKMDEGFAGALDKQHMNEREKKEDQAAGDATKTAAPQLSDDGSSASLAS